jgi:glycosyltransferase involved in cell wall biosynthesis
MNICFITNGILPVPAVKGGAVENLIQAILDKNEEYQRLNITVLSIFADGAKAAGKLYRNTSFVFVKPSLIIDIIDKIIFFCAGKILVKKNLFKYRYILMRLFYIYCCYKFLTKNNFDKIILENHHSLFLLLKNRHLLKNIAHKIYYHAHNQPHRDFLCKKQIMDCGNYITVSEYIRTTYMERYPSIASKFHILKNGVNTELFGCTMNKKERAGERKKYNIDENDMVVLFAGRISEEKGILELAEAFLQINNPALKLLITGSSFFDTGIESPLNIHLRNILRPCINRVVFTGYIKYEEIWKIYQAADFGCFPSICNEAALLVNIEAMAAGLPVITTNSGGIPEYVKPECAFILERDANLITHLKQAIETLAGDSTLRKAMGEKGREISAEYNLDTYYRNFLNILS